MNSLQLLSVLPLAALSFAQAPATIRGTVFGGSEITIPNALVAIRATGSGRTVSVVADYAGRYSASDLTGGPYRVTVSSFPGFPVLDANPQAGETAVVDFHIRQMEIDARFAKPVATTMAGLARLKSPGVSVQEVTDYSFGGYRGSFTSPPSADLNPRRAYVIYWKDHPYRFVFAHEGSYCPWFELPSGAGLSYQFFEGNAGWAELFNEWGRKERNSFVDVLEEGPDRVWVRWTYIAVNMKGGEAAYRATEDFWAYPNGLILRRQSYQTLRPGDPRGYAREPIEMIAMSPVGKLWFDLLAPGAATGESHALAVLDIFSPKRYDVFWKRAPGRIWSATPRRSGDTWQELDDARGVALIVPMRDGAPFCIFGDASGFRHDFTRIKEHSHKDTGGIGWVANSWDHWPVGWLNSQAHDVDAESVTRLPNHFSPAGMDFFALPNEESERGVFYSLLGVGGADVEQIRKIGRAWLEKEVGPSEPPR
ncbi:MAG: carboxypeptidase-like regulatory domain-containing protein [Acidobacteria bacterium]|nr:carboxypeptidase-like regulatory domain-containing protein [Acidobacteriota bacterium]